MLWILLSFAYILHGSCQKPILFFVKHKAHMLKMILKGRVLCK